MGMFDWVDFEIDCPKCGEKVTGFQTKDTECVLKTVKPSQIRDFYSICDNCQIWIQVYNKSTDSCKCKNCGCVGDQILELKIGKISHGNIEEVIEIKYQESEDIRDIQEEQDTKISNYLKTMED